MAHTINSRSVLAVRDLDFSTKYYVDILGFRKDSIDAPGSSFLTRDSFRVMLGECKGAQPASELGNHSYFAYWNIEGIDDLLPGTRITRSARKVCPDRQTVVYGNLDCVHPTAIESLAVR